MMSEHAIMTNKTIEKRIALSIKSVPGSISWYEIPDVHLMV